MEKIAGDTVIRELHAAVTSISAVMENGKIGFYFDGLKLTLQAEGEQGRASIPLEVIPLRGSPKGDYWFSIHRLLVSLKALNGTATLSMAREGVMSLSTEDAFYMQTAMRAPTGKKSEHTAKKTGSIGGTHLEEPNVCRYCGGIVRLVPAASIYGAATKRLGMQEEKIYQCQNCNARVGCHRGTTRPLGNVANEVLRLKRMETHHVFDRFWQEAKMSRTQAYQWLAHQLGLPVEKTHIGGFEMDRCQRVIDLCHQQENKKTNDLEMRNKL